jgi:hypothetical protein
MKRGELAALKAHDCSEFVARLLVSQSNGCRCCCWLFYAIASNEYLLSNN